MRNPELHPYQDVHTQGRVYQNLGVVATEQKDFENGKNYCKKALAIYEQYHDTHRQGQVYQNLGRIAQKQEDFREAEENYSRALERFLQFPEAGLYIWEIMCVVLTFAKQSGETASAKAMYEKALPYIAEKYKADLQALYDDLDKP